jgi:hypothetical protein
MTSVSKIRQTVAASLLLRGTSLLLVALFLFPAKAHAGLADLLTWLNTNDIGKALFAVREARTAIATLHQETVWPQQAIDNAKGLVLRTEQTYVPVIESIRHQPINSATLADTINLESALRSPLASNISSVTRSYSKVYQQLPLPSDASPAQRNIVDMDDTLASGALKELVGLDQGSQQMLDFANTLGQRTATSAPGSAPYLSAEAQLSSLQVQAHFLKILAADLRVEAGQVAHDNALLKQRALNSQALRNHLQGILSRP